MPLSRSLALAGFLSLSLAVAAVSDDDALPHRPDATCEAILDRFAQAISQAKMMEIEVTLHQQIVEEDEVVSFMPFRYSMSLGEGAQLRIEPVGVRKDDPLHQRLQPLTAVSDGEVLLILDAMHNRYIIQRAPDTWQAVVADLGISSVPGLQQFMFVLLPIIPDTDVIESKKVIDEGQTEQDGRVFQQCRIRVIDIEQARPDTQDPESGDHWLVWFEDGDVPVPRRIERQFQLSREFLGLQGRYKRGIVTLVFDEWRFLPDVDPARFVVEKPEDAILVSSHMQLLWPMPPGAVARPEVLLNKPAPDFRLLNRRGRPISLDALRRDRIVVLNFWTTRCTPCAEVLPDLFVIEQEFADRGVGLYTINVRGVPRVVERFLNNQGWDDVRVALDREGEVANQYLVGGMPRTVIVDREGIVRHVHTGYSRDLRARLRGALESILAEEANRDGGD